MNRLAFDKLLEALGGERRINYSLQRFETALAQVGHPEKDVQSVVIAGTNGKGTTTLLLSSALRSAGFSVSTYLSPHLQSPTERILADLVPIDADELADLGLEFEKVAQTHQLSYFEFMTLLSFIYAKRRGSLFHLIEVGLGGRLDATNVTDPLASVITNISFDHQAYLGNTLPEILNEKLGILRPESLLFSALRDPALIQLAENRCNELDTIYYFSKDMRTEVLRRDWRGQNVMLNGFPFRLNNPTAGTVENAALAFLTLRICFPQIPVETIARGFGNVLNPGRMEIVQERPRVILSGDHNPAGVDLLIKTFGEVEPQERGKLRILCAFSPDKPYRELYAALSQLSDEITLSQVSRFRDKMPADYTALPGYVPDPIPAVEALIRKSEPEDTVLVTGSLYLVGEVRSLWHPSVRFLRDP